MNSGRSAVKKETRTGGNILTYDVDNDRIEIASVVALRSGEMDY